MAVHVHGISKERVDESARLGNVPPRRAMMIDGDENDTLQRTHAKPETQKITAHLRVHVQTDLEQKMKGGNFGNALWSRPNYAVPPMTFSSLQYTVADEEFQKRFKEARDQMLKVLYVSESSMHYFLNFVSGSTKLEANIG